jgi:hypothetical protein
MSKDAIAAYYPHLENSDFETEMFYLLRLYSFWDQELLLENEMVC